MAGIRLQPPEPFNFRNPDDWQRWKRRFQQFREASGLDESAETKQVSTLLYSLGEEAEAVLALTNVTDAERKEYKKVLEKFDSFFQVRKNVIYERARFNKTSQQSGETAEQYTVHHGPLRSRRKLRLRRHEGGNDSRPPRRRHP